MTRQIVTQKITTDFFYNDQLQLAQLKNGVRVTSDSLLLAASIPALPDQRLFEIGSGSGIVSLGVAMRVKDVSGMGIDFQPELCRLANQNALNNGFNNFTFETADVTGTFAELIDVGLKPDSFDHSFANPPFFEQTSSRPASMETRTKARRYDEKELDDWVRILCAFTRQKGSTTVIYPASKIGTLLQAFNGRFGDIRVLPLHTKPGQNAYRVLIRGIRGSKAETKILPGLILQDETGHYHHNISQILNGKILEMN